MGITIEQILALAVQQDGYLEKATPKDEDSLTANAGSNNFTKFGRDLAKHIGSPYADGVAWCDMYVDWLFWKLGGKQGLMENLYGCSAYTPTSAQYYKNNQAWYSGNSPRPGFQIFFKNSQRICHTGLVTKCANGMVYTIEGNTSSAAGVVANGGCVRQKAYSLAYKSIAGYGIPKCIESQSSYVNLTLVTEEKNARIKDVKMVQTYLNTVVMPHLIKGGIFKNNLEIDGEYGKMTRHAILAFWKNEMNKSFKCGFDPKNSYFGPSCKLHSDKCLVHFNMKGMFPLIVQLLLKAKGFYEGDLDGIFGKQSCAAVVKFENANHLIAEVGTNAMVGQQVWFALFN